MPKFVVHEHYAKTHHFDLRLERDDVLWCWAVPKGIPLEMGVRRLAIRTEDHDKSALTFEGEIEEGKYGAGKIVIWDRGEFTFDSIADNKIVFRVKGEKMHGKYVLVRMPKAGEDAWLIFRGKDN
ncbi:MAG: 3'-phosphoesterase [Candidatus Coatesbacteria bacterium 4484_99]|uniref:3'-phosphoesterase n=1 Tax=Candidatus Coatesbacteria bacterium 4484_99 TaxID=1970774 RepID=A0A1W9S088_9BACT|nr:MAG: 3'-phosphoesterase [Candidatus Coatesbacteria bacterium 4484_99]RLC40810.1 MAG: 3'-phosphoesterase [Candidatus Coatesbacteria bacterium]RLC41555.1 MAG: 3'-phosphoesterase [Candidatus Coatesbacteria bacterium]RLC43591.1 MAG: 3'-phosphoesterase [Candidatus Coatesbacteria bacterium]HEC79898.1 3'-phosphoesterase [Bacillota bacterium]